MNVHVIHCCLQVHILHIMHNMILHFILFNVVEKFIKMHIMNVFTKMSFVVIMQVQDEEGETGPIQGRKVCPLKKRLVFASKLSKD